MGLKGKMVRKIEIKSDGDKFLENYRYNPQHFSNMSPGNVRNVDFPQGDRGAVGSVIVWHYNQGLLSPGDDDVRITGTGITSDEINASKDSNPEKTNQILHRKINESTDDYWVTLSVFSVGDDKRRRYYLGREREFLAKDEIPDKEDIPLDQQRLIFADGDGTGGDVGVREVAVKADAGADGLLEVKGECIQILSGVSGVLIEYFKQMGLKGKMVRKVEIKSDGDMFLENYRYNPQHFSKMSPGNVRNVDFPQGDRGTVGSVIVWQYNQDGKGKTDKTLVEVIDEENKLMTLTVVEGDLLQQYKTYRVSIQVDTKGEKHSVIWTVEYEKLSGDIEDPTTFMDMLVGVTKDIEVHHLNQYTN
ncbi:hypothetical protein RHSIM_Rhsim09G0094800 [Rhododendron simsii]|uniref:Bet v I/Major latex protein domain-containing protein n=1 Tax=Rhododendron simsii TaxID=118357 RepID=A0A834LET9_RHOSS|nr:hypothetical protein RHSIM_Rhsim09G0094800 [Rhododendron simsii]